MTDILSSKLTFQRISSQQAIPRRTHLRNLAWITADSFHGKLAKSFTLQGTSAEVGRKQINQLGQHGPNQTNLANKGIKQLGQASLHCQTLRKKICKENLLNPTGRISYAKNNSLEEIPKRTHYRNYIFLQKHPKMNSSATPIEFP